MPVPNLIFLQHALEQTQGVGRFNAQQWREGVRERLQVLDMQAVRKDVLPFLERMADGQLLNHENLERLLT